MATVTSVPGTLDITPDPLQKQSKVQIRRNNKKGRIEIVTSTDSGNNYKTLLPEVTSKVQAGSIPVVQESGDVEWSVLAAKASTLTGVVSYVNGGTGYGSYAAGDILYANQQGVLAKLPIGSTDQLLTVSNALPVWQDATDTLINKTIESAILTGNTTLSSTSTFTPAAGATLDLSAANVILPTSTLSGFGYKAPVRAATTASITLSGIQTIDNVALATGDRVLVKNQSTASQNGIYIVSASTWTRSADLNVWSEASAAVVVVQEGTLNQDTVWLSTANASGGTIGSTNMPWGMIGVDQTGSGLTTQVLVGGGNNLKPVWTTATGTGAPVRAGSPTFTGNITFGGHILPSLDSAYDIGQSADPRIRNIYCVGTAYLQNISCAANVFASNYQDTANAIAFFKIGQDSTHSFFFTNREASASKVVLSIGTQNATQTADLFHCYQNSVQKFGVSTAGTVTLAGKVIIPVTSATAGIIEQNGERFIHSFTPANKNQNIFIGYQAGRTTTVSEGGNLGIGRVVMTSLTDGANNVCLGDGAGYQLTSGSSNIIVGVSAGGKLNTGAHNVACGHGSLGACEDSGSNAAFGHQALGKQTGGQSTGIGMNAGYSSTGNDNVFVGQTAGYAGTTVGNLLGIAVESGTNNTMLGQASSSTLAAGTYRTAIGSNSRCQTNNAIKLGRDYSASNAGGAGNAGDKVIFPSFPTANLPSADVVSGMVVNDSTINTLKYYNGTAWNPVVTAETLTGATLASTVLASSLTSVGTLTGGTWNANVIAGQYGGTGVANTDKTITLGGNLTTTGNFTTELITTAATSVTLPTSGTLVSDTVTTLSSLTSVGTLTSGTWNANVITGQYGGTGVNNGTSTITLGGNLTTNGAHTTTLSTTGNTNVTLPVSGTLVSDTVTTLSSLTSVSTLTTGTWQANVIVGAYGGTGVNNTGKTITLGGNLITSGSHTTTLTTTSNTNVTLPASGTLVTQTALDSKANLASPTFTGTVTIPSGASISGFAPLASPTFTGAPLLPTGTIATTQTANDNTTALATTAFVTTADNLKANLASPTFTGTVGGITKSMVGLSNVNDTSDLGKPISTLTQTALDLKANLASPTFTGTPLSTTAAVDTNTTQIATTAYVIGQGYAKLTGVAITPTTVNGNTITTGTGTLTLGVNTINLAAGSGVGSTGGYINMSGSIGQDTAGGYINTSGGNSEDGAYGGYINTSGANTGSGTGENCYGGYINTSGSANYPGGVIDTRSEINGSGGNINLNAGAGATGGSGGDLNMSGSTSGNMGGGYINTSGGSSVGGYIDTSDGGGSISTRGVGSIGLGVAATRTTLVGSATSARTVTIPDFNGSFLLDSFPWISENFLDWVGQSVVTIGASATSSIGFGAATSTSLKTRVYSPLEYTSSVVAALVVGGGVYIAKKIQCASSITCAGTANSFGATTVTGNFTYGAPISTPAAQTATATTSAVSITTHITALTCSTAASVMTLANGTAGQTKIIQAVNFTGAGAATLTPTTKTGFSTITFTATGNTVTLCYHTTIGWMIVSNYGCTIA